MNENLLHVRIRKGNKNCNKFVLPTEKKEEEEAESTQTYLFVYVMYLIENI